MARNVSFTIVEAGENALKSKIDKKDAYKLIPTSIEDLRLQGFSFGGKFSWKNNRYLKHQVS
jgi:hypothetical protein